MALIKKKEREALLYLLRSGNGNFIPYHDSILLKHGCNPSEYMISVSTGAIVRRRKI